MFKEALAHTIEKLQKGVERENEDGTITVKNNNEQMPLSIKIE